MNPQNESMSITIHSIYIGQPQTMSHEKGEWSSSIYRTLVEGPIELGEHGLTGDQVTDTKHHGQPYQNVCCHSIEHYEFWNAHYDIAGTDQALGPSAVGENWTLLDADEEEICVGDIYSVGTAQVEVTGPRYPCFKQERKVGLPAFLKCTIEHMRTGFYLRTLQTGEVEAGNMWTLEDRPCPGVTIRHVSETVLHTKDVKAAKLILEAPALAENWKNALKRLK